MSKRETYEQRSEAILAPIVDELGLKIYDVEYVKEGDTWYLRLYIDKDGGVDIIDCENVTRAFSQVMDEDDFIPDAYILEVSSPGLGRTLKKDKHLQYSIGEEVEIKTYKPINKSKEFSGILLSVDEENIVLDIEGTSQTFLRTDVALVRLALDF